MNIPATLPYPAAAAGPSAAATAAATAKVQRIDLWRQEVAVALSTPANQDGKRFINRRRRHVCGNNGSENGNDNGNGNGGSSSSNNYTLPSSTSSLSPPVEQTPPPKTTSFLARLLRSKGSVGRAGAADAGLSYGDGSGKEIPRDPSFPRSYPFESTAMYRSILVPMPPTPTRPRASLIEDDGGGNDHWQTGNYEGADEEESMKIAGLITDSSSSLAAGLLARQRRLERAARLLGKSVGREGKG